MGAQFSRTRGIVLKKVRAMARSGHHTSCYQIYDELQGSDTLSRAGSWLEDARFIAQIDATCAIAKARKRVPAA